MKRPAIAIIALSMTASTALAADYELFAPTYISTSKEQHWLVERLDYVAARAYHCNASIQRETKRITGQCKEHPGFPQKSASPGPTLHKLMSNQFGGVPVGFWQINRSSGKTEFCATDLECLDLTPPS